MPDQDDGSDKHSLIQQPRDHADIAKELDLSNPGSLLDELPNILAELRRRAT